MTPPDGSESGPAATADVAATSTEDAPEEPLPGHATMTTDVATEAPRAPDLEQTPEIAAESDSQDEGEDRNLFSDLDTQEAPEVEETTAAPVAAAAAPAPVTVPDDPEEDAFAPESGVLSYLLARRSPLPPATAARALALAQDLVALR